MRLNDCDCLSACHTLLCQAWCPYMPLAIDKPYLFVDGVREEVYGAVMQGPEWNQQDLLQGRPLG